MGRPLLPRRRRGQRRSTRCPCGMCRHGRCGRYRHKRGAGDVGAGGATPQLFGGITREPKCAPYSSAAPLLTTLALEALSKRCGSAWRPSTRRGARACACVVSPLACHGASLATTASGRTSWTSKLHFRRATSTCCRADEMEKRGSVARGGARALGQQSNLGLACTASQLFHTSLLPRFTLTTASIKMALRISKIGTRRCLDARTAPHPYLTLPPTPTRLERGRAAGDGGSGDIAEATKLRPETQWPPTSSEQRALLPLRRPPRAACARDPTPKPLRHGSDVLRTLAQEATTSARPGGSTLRCPAVHRGLAHSTRIERVVPCNTS